MNTDEHAVLLREIRDALQEQTALVKEQHADNASMIRRNQILSVVITFPLTVALAALLVLR